MRRDTAVKASLQNENLEVQLKSLLDTVHTDMYNRALVERDANMAVTSCWDEFCQLLDEKKIIQAPYCGGEVIGVTRCYQVLLGCYCFISFSHVISMNHLDTT